VGDSLNRYTVTSELRFNDISVQRSSTVRRFGWHAVIWRKRVIRASTCLCAAILAIGLQAAENISVLGNKPRWDALEHYQQTITRDEFAHLINDVYGTHGFAPDLIEIKDDRARILVNRDAQKFFTLRFAAGTEELKPVPRLWRAAKSLPSAERNKPLSGLKIALDPGHLGGSWAKMEERWFQVGDSKPVQEGDLTLSVARLLATRLRDLGARVSFVRSADEPTTGKRPDDFRELARKILIRNGVPQPRTDVLDSTDPEKEKTIRWQSEILFYRYSEIRRRAALVNFKLHPDLVLCLHFNAEGWGDPTNPLLTDTNHLHLLVNGSYLAEELEFDDQRFEMIRRVLSRAYDEELSLADTIALTMSRETGLPPYAYPTTNSTTKVGTSGYVYARNLLATRLYRCPVVYCEPYVMNSKDVFARIQAGDYEGTRNVNGVERKSIFREYADSVAEGLVEYYSKAREL
jgi:N-acetylmuramoyl-L-alanine amidase